MFVVKVFSGGLLVDEHTFASMAAAATFADEAQDLGFKVRIAEKQAEYAY
jgi:hypothetical protein